MARIRGFYCGRCRAEVLATSAVAASTDRNGWIPPILCCDESLRPLETGEVVPLLLARRRVACCPQCGIQLTVVVHPVGAFFCQVCQKELRISPRMPLEHPYPARESRTVRRDKP
jgi:hypothetical protein